MRKNSVTPAAPGEPRKWTPEQIEYLKGIQTEIGAGKCLINRDGLEESAYNGACDRAISIVQHYIDGFGLFMMTRNRPLPAQPESQKGSSS